MGKPSAPDQGREDCPVANVLLLVLKPAASCKPLNSWLCLFTFGYGFIYIVVIVRYTHKVFGDYDA